MTKAQIDGVLEDFDHWRRMTNIERMKFARTMRGRIYGRSALEIACAWWVHGYRTGEKQ